MGSQTIGSSSCCPSYPPPGASFLQFLENSFTCFLKSNLELALGVEEKGFK